tara:strand:+ start:150 stop:398 length:249 start_codon:yes stop_codon:yes gene_type:complete
VAACGLGPLALDLAFLVLGHLTFTFASFLLKERLEPKIGENAATSDKAKKCGRLEDGAAAADFLEGACGHRGNTVKVDFLMM